MLKRGKFSETWPDSLTFLAKKNQAWPTQNFGPKRPDPVHFSNLKIYNPDTQFLFKQLFHHFCSIFRKNCKILVNKET